MRRLLQPWRILVLKNNIAANLEEIREEIKKDFEKADVLLKTALCFLDVLFYYYEILKKKNF